MVTRMAKLYEEGKLTDAHASVAKAFCTAKCRETVAWRVRSAAATASPSNTVSAASSPTRKLSNTYEGTYQMQNLIIGQRITGFSAFL